MIDREHASIGYLGWSRRGNLGDDVIEEALHGVLPGVDFEHLPHKVVELPEALRRGMETHSFGQPLVLGGGTAIGRRNWRYTMAVAGRLLARGDRFMLGAGVEDPRFVGARSFSGRGELRRWGAVLRSFDHVTVRGPRSQQLLADIGIEAEVIGDPALLLEPVRPAGRGHAVAVNLGYGDDLWGHDHRVVETEFRRLLDWCAATGRDVVALTMSTQDGALLDTLLAQAEPDLRARVRVRRAAPSTAQEFFAAVDGTEVVVAERLHAQVLAIAAGIPTVAVEYQPKCRDFVESVGQEHLSVRTDRLSPGALIGLAEEAIRTGTEVRSELDRRLAHLRGLLRREADHVTASIDPAHLPRGTTSSRGPCDAGR